MTSVDKDTDKMRAANQLKELAPFPPTANYQEQWPCVLPLKLLLYAFYTFWNYDFDIIQQSASGNSVTFLENI